MFRKTIAEKVHSDVTKTCRSGRIVQISMKGHAGYEEAGKDIVCAAASVTAYTCAGAIGELAGIPDCYTTGDGMFEIVMPDNAGVDEEKRKIAETILETTYIGFKQIELSYPKYLKVIEVFDRQTV